MISRRAFIGTIAGGLFAAPLAAEAQPAGKVYRIGSLGPGSPAPANNFLQGLVDLGYVEGRDFVIEYRWAEAHPDRLPELAADLVQARVDVIVTGGTPGAAWAGGSGHRVTGRIRWAEVGAQTRSQAPRLFQVERAAAIRASEEGPLE
jgi:hypothetical protein